MAKDTVEITSKDVATLDAKSLTNDRDTLAGIASFADAIRVLESAGIAIHSSEEFGDGFSVVASKDQLIGVPFVILGMRQTEGDHGEFSILHVVTEPGDKFIIVDGSTGIHAQVTEYLEKGVQSVMHKGGLNRSDYTYVDDKGKESPASTYYLS